MGCASSSGGGHPPPGGPSQSLKQQPSTHSTNPNSARGRRLSFDKTSTSNALVTIDTEKSGASDREPRVSLDASSLDLIMARVAASFGGSISEFYVTGLPSAKSSLCSLNKILPAAIVPTDEPESICVIFEESCRSDLCKTLDQLVETLATNWRAARLFLFSPLDEIDSVSSVAKRSIAVIGFAVSCSQPLIDRLAAAKSVCPHVIVVCSRAHEDDFAPHAHRLIIEDPPALATALSDLKDVGSAASFTSSLHAGFSHSLANSRHSSEAHPLFAPLLDYCLHANNGRSNGNTPLIVASEGGLGRSSLVASTAAACRAAGAAVFEHFCALSFSSRGSMAVLHRLVKFLNSILGRTVPPHSSIASFQALHRKFLNLIFATAALPQRVVIFLDSAELIDASYNGHSLRWLPQTTPGNVSVVITSSSHTVPREDFRRLDLVATPPAALLAAFAASRPQLQPFLSRLQSLPSALNPLFLAMFANLCDVSTDLADKVLVSQVTTLDVTCAILDASAKRLFSLKASSHIPALQTSQRAFLLTSFLEFGPPTRASRLQRSATCSPSPQRPFAASPLLFAPSLTPLRLCSALHILLFVTQCALRTFPHPRAEGMCSAVSQTTSPPRAQPSARSWSSLRLCLQQGATQNSFP